MLELRNRLPVLIVLLSCSAVFPQTDTLSLQLHVARNLFYASVTDKKQIEPALAAFQAIRRDYPALAGRALTYIGAVEALRGKHAFWPHDKLHLAKRGIAIMDEGVAQAPDDIEALFIHSSTCYFLPFFFNRGKDAQEKFRTILQLLPRHFQAYEPGMIRNVVLFIAEKAHLDEDGQLLLQQLKEELGLANTP